MISEEELQDLEKRNNECGCVNVIYDDELKKLIESYREAGRQIKLLNKLLHHAAGILSTTEEFVSKHPLEVLEFIKRVYFSKDSDER